MQCPRCSYHNSADAPVCNLCGELLVEKAAVTQTIDTRERVFDRIFLHCFVRFPLEVTKDRPATIGRVEGNDIVLPAKVVSRRHARVEYVDGQFHVIDQGSSNGTHVNEQQIKDAVVVPGDEIRIGSFIIHVRKSGEGIEPADEDASATMVVSPTGDARAASGFAGKLEEMGLGEISTIIEMTRKSGTVVLRLKSGVAKIYFKDGQIVNAEGCNQKGEKAFFEIFRQSEGTFEFEQGVPLVKKVIQVPTTSLLLEAARMSDEASQG